MYECAMSCASIPKFAARACCIASIAPAIAPGPAFIACSDLLSLRSLNEGYCIPRSLC